MRQYIVCRIFISFISLFLFLGMGCDSPSPTSSTSSKTTDIDSIIYYLSDANSGSDKEYSNHLNKAYRLASQVSDASEKSKYFADLALSYLSVNDSTQFRKSNRIAIALSQKTKDSTSLANNHWDLASFFVDYAVEDSAYYHYAESEKIFRALDDPFYTARMLYNMALVQSAIKDYIGSEINTIKAIELFKPLDRYENLYHCYNNLGSLSNALGEYDQALEYYNQALFYLNRFSPSETERLDTYNNIGIVYQGMEQHAKALETFNKALITNKGQIEDIRAYATVLSNYAYSQSKLGDTTGVMQKFRRTLDIRDSLNDIRGLPLINYQISEYLLSHGDSTNALKYAKTAQFQAQLGNNNLRTLEVLELLGRVDPQNATQYLQAYIKLNDSLIHEERTIQNKFTRIRFETDQFIEQNVQLTQQRQLWSGIAIGAIALGVVTLLMLDQRRKNQKLRFEQVQQRANQEIFNLLLEQNRKVEEGKQLEKKRVSEELHDGILGQMLGIRLILSGLNNKTDPDSVIKRGDLLGKLQQVEEEIRTISHELNRASQEKINNFIISIEELVQTIRDSSEMQCQFKYDDRLDWDHLKADIKINIYRIIQESLQNCLKHAKASMVEVELGYEENQLTVQITDNGIGFNTNKGKKGIGLKNINSRLTKLQGTYQLQSEIGKGTRAIARIPYELNQETNTIST